MTSEYDARSMRLPLWTFLESGRELDGGILRTFQLMESLFIPPPPKDDLDHARDASEAPLALESTQTLSLVGVWACTYCGRLDKCR